MNGCFENYDCGAAHENLMNYVLFYVRTSMCCVCQSYSCGRNLHSVDSHLCVRLLVIVFREKFSGQDYQMSR